MNTLTARNQIKMYFCKKSLFALTFCLKSLVSHLTLNPGTEVPSHSALRGGGKTERCQCEGSGWSVVSGLDRLDATALTTR